MRVKPVHNKLGVRLQVHEEEAVQLLHLPYSFECPVCRKEQQHVLMCLLCGAFFPAECDEQAHSEAPEGFDLNGIHLSDVVKTRWLGQGSVGRHELESLAEDPTEPVTRTSLGFLDQHGRPKRLIQDTPDMWEKGARVN